MLRHWFAVSAASLSFACVLACSATTGSNEVGNAGDGSDAQAAGDDAASSIVDGGRGPDGRSSGPADAHADGSPDAADAFADAPADVVVVRTRQTINFDDLPEDAVVTTSYSPFAVFSAPTGTLLALDPYDFGQSAPNLLCALSGSVDCLGIKVAFTKPVTNVSFRAVGVNSTSTAAHVTCKRNGATVGSANIVGDGAQYTPISINLASCGEVDEVIVDSVDDLDGIGFDDFAFDYPS